MIAVQCIKLEWDKENRSPHSSVIRRDYSRPLRISDNTDLSMKGDAFVQILNYCQDKNGTVIPNDEMISKRILSLKDQDTKKWFLDRAYESKAKKDGIWYEKIEDAVIPGVEIFRSETDYDVFWHQLEGGCYFPFRKGVNVNYSNKNSRISGKRIKCEKAFSLKPGENGLLLYNYRYSHESQHYEQYSVYILNCSSIRTNSFSKAEYSHKYEEMAYLF